VAGIRKSRIKIKRAYEEPGPSDGTRILVDPLWPRELTKKKLALTVAERRRIL
jgi:uncharacterized protein YeaO (DUF488 family)